LKVSEKKERPKKTLFVISAEEEKGKKSEVTSNATERPEEKGGWLLGGRWSNRKKAVLACYHAQGKKLNFEAKETAPQALRRKANSRRNSGLKGDDPCKNRFEQEGGREGGSTKRKRSPLTFKRGVGSLGCVVDSESALT